MVDKIADTRDKFHHPGAPARNPTVRVFAVLEEEEHLSENDDVVIPSAADKIEDDREKDWSIISMELCIENWRKRPEPATHVDAWGISLNIVQKEKSSRSI